MFEKLQMKWSSAQDLAIKFLLKNFRCIAPVQNLCSCVTPHQQLSGDTSDIHSAPTTLSMDLAPADFSLFPKLKTTLKGRRFQTTEEI
jgi:hypothetical protein